MVFSFGALLSLLRYCTALFLQSWGRWEDWSCESQAAFVFCALDNINWGEPWLSMLSTDVTPPGKGISAFKARTPSDLLHIIREEDATDFQRQWGGSLWLCQNLWILQDIKSIEHENPISSEDSVTYWAQHCPPWMVCNIYRCCFGKQQMQCPAADLQQWWTSQSWMEQKESKKEGEDVIMPVLDASPVDPSTLGNDKL